MTQFEHCDLEKAKDLVKESAFYWTEALYYAGWNRTADARDIITLVLRHQVPIDTVVDALERTPSAHIDRWNRVFTLSCWNDQALVVDALLQNNFKYSNRRFQLPLNAGFISACRAGRPNKFLRGSFNSHQSTIEILLKHRFTGLARYATHLKHLITYKADIIGLFQNNALALSQLKTLKSKHYKHANKLLACICNISLVFLLHDLSLLIRDYLFFL